VSHVWGNFSSKHAMLSFNAAHLASCLSQFKIPRKYEYKEEDAEVNLIAFKS